MRYKAHAASRRGPAMPSHAFPLLALLALATPAIAQNSAQNSTTHAGVSGVRLRDAGIMRMGGTGPYGRTEVFEYLDQPDGSHILLNSITAANGSYRVQVRFDLTPDWRSVSARGTGLYDGTPVSISMTREAGLVAIRVQGQGIDLAPKADCTPDCFINMSPSATAMFLMTRHYDMQKGGVQSFTWAGQDLDRKRTLSGGRSNLSFKAMRPITRRDGSTLNIQHFTFVESLPTPDGGRYNMDFDLWVDEAHRPMGFRITSIKVPVIGFREGHEDVQAALISQKDE